MPLLIELATMECGGRLGLMALDQVEEGVSDTRDTGTQSKGSG